MTRISQEPFSTGRWRLALTMYSPLAAIVRREPVTVGLDATVREALETMERQRVGTVVVIDPLRRIPLGIFTLQDLVRRVTFAGGDLQQPIASVMTSGLITLSSQATAHQAALTMARNAVRHVVVVDGEERLVGIVSQSDLFALQRVGVKEISAEIQGAASVDGLKRAALGIRRLASGLLAQGVAAETLTHVISTLNDLLTIRAIELAADEIELPPVPMCWVAFGAEGRLEQTFATDQDNGIIFEVGAGEIEEVRQALLPFARAVNHMLDACGFELCKGNVMAGNPQCCLSLGEWTDAFSRWMDQPGPRAVLNSTIFFDLRPIYGNDRLAEQLREWMLEQAARHPMFLRFLAAAGLQSRPPLGRIRAFVYDGSKEFPHTIDLKLGARPFVDAARVFALARGLSPTSTAQRLRAVADDSVEPAEGFSAEVDGFYFVHMLRLRNQVRAGTTTAGANRIDPRDLNELERHLLREAFRQTRRLQRRLELDYRL